MNTVVSTDEIRAAWKNQRIFKIAQQLLRDISLKKTVLEFDEIIRYRYIVNVEIESLDQQFL